MEINWCILAVIIIVVILLVSFLIKQNKKDRKKIEKHLNFTPKSDEEEINDDHNL